MRHLTKVIFKKAVECPRKLKYASQPHIYKNVDEDVHDTFRQSLVETGYQIGEYAKLQFPHGVEVDGNQSREEAVKRTRELLLCSDDVVVFEGAIEHEGLFVRADIIEKTKDGGLHLIEVKAKSWDSRAEGLISGKRAFIKATFLPYIQDVAFQHMVLQAAFPNLPVRASLMLPDKAVTTEVPNLNALFRVARAGRHSAVHVSQAARQSIAAAGENILATVDVDVFVRHVLNSPLSFPGSCAAVGQGQDAPYFTETVATWAQYISLVAKQQVGALDRKGGGWNVAAGYESGANTATACAAVNVPPVERAPIGSQCKTCEYRISGERAAPRRSGFEECWAEATMLTKEELREPSILDLYSAMNKGKLINKGIYRLSDVKAEDLGLNLDGTLKSKPRRSKKGGAEKGSDSSSSSSSSSSNGGLTRAQRQWYQVQGERGMVIETALLAEEMDTWDWPLHFIDFETSAPALPFSRHRAPFEMIAFQFSHHILHADGLLEHATEFLHAEPGVCPNMAFLGTLARAVGSRKGSVFQWSSHEDTVLTGLLREYDGICASDVAGAKEVTPSEADSLRPLLRGGNRAMIDLMQVAARCYYVPDGSTSIKKMLLPTLALSHALCDKYGQPGYCSNNFTDFTWWRSDGQGGAIDPYALLGEEHDDRLPEILAAPVADGGAALLAYQVLQCDELTDCQRDAIHSSLKRYCELDTLAMAMIVQAWQAELDSKSHTI